MRQTISGLLAAIAVLTVSSASALACGYGGCSPCGASYVQPCAHTHVWTGCNTGCGWAHERLADPMLQYHSAHRAHQYYYVNQGPTYTGPGSFAPYRTYYDYDGHHYDDAAIEGTYP